MSEKKKKNTKVKRREMKIKVKETFYEIFFFSNENSEHAAREGGNSFIASDFTRSVFHFAERSSEDTAQVSLPMTYNENVFKDFAQRI